MFMFSPFMVSKSHQKAMSKVRTIVCLVNIIKVTFVIKRRLHEGRRSPAIIWLHLWFSPICLCEISKNFLSLWKLSCPSLKSRKKIGVTKTVSSLFAICVFFLYLKFELMDFFNQRVQAPGRTQICLTVQQILGNSTEGKAINLTQKIPNFFVAKHYVME